IPFMTDGAGARWIGPWFGTGPDRGMALVFIATGVIGLVVTLLARASRPYRQLSEAYHDKIAASGTPDGSRPSRGPTRRDHRVRRSAAQPRTPRRRSGA